MNAKRSFTGMNLLLVAVLIFSMSFPVISASATKPEYQSKYNNDNLQDTTKPKSNATVGKFLAPTARQITLRNNNFSENQTYGLSTNSSVTAIQNWWGQFQRSWACRSGR